MLDVPYVQSPQSNNSKTKQIFQANSFFGIRLFFIGPGRIHLPYTTNHRIAFAPAGHFAHHRFFAQGVALGCGKNALSGRGTIGTRF